MEKDGIKYYWRKVSPLLHKDETGKWDWLQELMVEAMSNGKTLVTSVPNEQVAKFRTAVYKIRRQNQELRNLAIHIKKQEDGIACYFYAEKPEPESL